jgi:hypothetical protein
MSLLHFAREHGAVLLDPVPEEVIAEFEERTGLAIPPGLRSFYLACGGTREFTDSFWRIWEFGYLAPVSEYVRCEESIEFPSDAERPPLRDYLAFCDVLIHLPIYAVCANPHNENYGRMISLMGDQDDQYQCLAGPTCHFDDFVESLKVDWEGEVFPD